MKKLTVPSGWNEVSIGMFQELTNLDKTSDGLTKVIELISILSDTDSEEVKKISSIDLEPILEAIQWTSKSPRSEFKTEITIDGEVYYLVKLSDMSIAESADLDSYSSDITQLHKFFAVLYRKPTDTYDVDSMLKRAELFSEKLNIDDVYGTLVFFLNIAIRYEEIIKTYSQSQSTKKKSEVKVKPIKSED